MKTEKLIRPWTKTVVVLMAVSMVPDAGWACACGCGIFDVGTSSMFPTGQGGMAFFNYAYQDQNRNWSGTSQAPAADNTDKEIETHFLSVGLQYMFNYDWGIEAEVPYDFRTFKTSDSAGNIITKQWSQLGDIRLRGIYTGLFPDQSAGITLGVKLPTGSYTFDPADVDRDTQLGTGSTDLLLGGFYRNSLFESAQIDWFAQTELDLPLWIQDQYRPGLEWDTAVGAYYKGWSIGRMQIVPITQMLFSERQRDNGENASSPAASGYQRLLLSPGIEFHLHPVKLYADAEFPVYQNFTGNQLAAPVLIKVTLSVMF